MTDISVAPRGGHSVPVGTNVIVWKAIVVPLSRPPSGSQTTAGTVRFV